MSEKTDEYYGIVDLPINPSTVSIGTINVSENVCLETLVIGPNAAVYLSGLEFVILLDGQPLWDGHVPETGRHISVPAEMSHSEDKRLLMVLVNPSDYLPPMDFDTSSILVAVKGSIGECPLMIDIPDYPEEFDTDSEGNFAFDTEFQADWS